LLFKINNTKQKSKATQGRPLFVGITPHPSRYCVPPSPAGEGFLRSISFVFSMA
jgi:hypothetical protein